MGGTAQFQAAGLSRRALRPLQQDGGYSTWHSDNTSVFTVSSGLVSCLQPGSGTVAAEFQATVYGQWCASISIYPRPSGAVTVVRVTFQKADGGALPSPLRVGISATTLGGEVHDRTQHLRASVEGGNAGSVSITGDSKVSVFY